MVCVFAEADIAYDEEGREELAEFLDGEDDGSVRVVCWCAFVVLHVALVVGTRVYEVINYNLVTMQRHAKENDAIQPLLNKGFEEGL